MFESQNAGDSLAPHLLYRMYMFFVPMKQKKKKKHKKTVKKKNRKSAASGTSL